MIQVTMPKEHWAKLWPNHPFDSKLLAQVKSELDGLAALLLKEGEGCSIGAGRLTIQAINLPTLGVTVYRPSLVDWGSIGGYTAAMPRDALLTVGRHVIESPFAWNCRRHEI